MRNSYFAVEGVHEAAAVGALLKLNGFRRIGQYTAIPQFWNRLIPTKFPHNNDLLARVPVPFFYHKGDLTVAVHSGGGWPQLTTSIVSTLNNIGYEHLYSIGVFFDADNCSSSRFAQFLNSCSIIDPFGRLRSAGVIETGPPKTGVFILPDCSASGCLDHVLVDCAQLVYPELAAAAQHYTDCVRHVSKWRNYDELKVMVGCIANALRPGKANQVSVQDDRWLSEGTIELPHVASLNSFIVNLVS